MANEEQVKMLKQGAEVWNAWKIEHPDEKIDLYEANLREIDLIKVHLIRANLQGADLTGADLRWASLRGANLREADLRKASLGWANLKRARLTRTNLQGAYLEGARLTQAHLEGADLTGADLRRADLTRAYLTRAHLREAHLRETRLIQTILREATITGVRLYGTARDDWIIDGIICDYVFWDLEGSKRTPKDRDFRPGEFEELYNHLPTFNYYFKHGFTALDAVVMDRVVQAINERHPEFELKLDSFHSRGQPHAVFTVLHKDDVEPAQKQITTDYEARLAALEGKQEQMMELFARVVNNPQLIVTGDLTIGDKRMIQAGRDYLEHIEGAVSTGDSSPEEQENQ